MISCLHSLTNITGCYLLLNGFSRTFTVIPWYDPVPGYIQSRMGVSGCFVGFMENPVLKVAFE